MSLPPTIKMPDIVNTLTNQLQKQQPNQRTDILEDYDTQTFHFIPRPLTVYK